MKIKVTQYGRSVKDGGWDEYGDTFTDKFEGDHGNELIDETSCALTKSAQQMLQIKHGEWISIDFGNNIIEFRRYDDTAPENDPRIDLFNYNAFVNGLPEFADVLKHENFRNS